MQLGGTMEGIGLTTDRTTGIGIGTGIGTGIGIEAMSGTEIEGKTVGGMIDVMTDTTEGSHVVREMMA